MCSVQPELEQAALALGQVALTTKGLLPVSKNISHDYPKFSLREMLLLFTQNSHESIVSIVTQLLKMKKIFL